MIKTGIPLVDNLRTGWGVKEAAKLLDTILIDYVLYAAEANAEGNTLRDDFSSHILILRSLRDDLAEMTD